MKKLIAVCGLAVFAALLAICSPSFAVAGHYTEWDDHTVPVDGNYTFYFTPGQAGDHTIEFLNQQDIYNGGWMVSAWGSINDNPIVWHQWATSDVLYYKRIQALYTGSADIVFRFTFINIVDEPVTFYWRHYIDY